MTIPQGANQRWSLDFASDALADGRRLRILILVDDFTRECLALRLASGCASWRAFAAAAAIGVSISFSPRRG